MHFNVHVHEADLTNESRVQFSGAISEIRVPIIP